VTSGDRVRFVIDPAEAQRLSDEGHMGRVEEFACGVDLPECRHRLWSIRDNQIGYYLRNYSKEREAKLSSSSFSRKS